MNYSCFKAYDVRGRVPDELNNEIAIELVELLLSSLMLKRCVLGMILD